MEIESTFTCAYCFETITTSIDVSGGTYQEYIEDCQVCCRPNLLRITVAEDLQSAVIAAEPS